MRLGTLLVFAALASSARADQPKIDVSKLPPAAGGQIDFTRDIHPIFAKSCYSCHGPDKQRGGLRLDDPKAAMQGSNSGAVIKPGKALESRLLHVVGGLDPEVMMPPKEKTPLTKVEIAKLRAWIDHGAPWSQETVKTAKTKSNHWAFQPIKRVRVPAMKSPTHPIDSFILDRLQKEKLTPSPEADRVTLIRRLHLDLLGLPPTPAEIDEFVNDMSPNAYEKLVDRVLGSLHYGERWGRHWLDLARYADSDGYEADRPRPFAWRYRNWVIDAFNRDMPFDQFTVEQLAGDLLPGATLAQKTATGFHRNTLTNKEGGTDKEQFRVEACVDRVNTTFKAFFGLTMGCAQCHDHKYDPFSQREYYQLFALFNSDEEVDVPASYPGDGYAQQKAAFDKKRADLQAKIADYKQSGLPLSVAKWEEKLTPGEKAKLPENITAVLAVAADKRNMKQQTALANYYSKLDQKMAELTKALAAHDRAAPKEPVVSALALGKGRKTHVMIRGDFLRPGVEVAAATPAALHSISHGPQPVGLPPTRLHFAKWITQPENPLSARVISNWVWHKFFGRGIVATLEDFGTQGEKPSHPELLDFLASYFMGEAKWSFKELHKLIVTSATYRQSSKVRAELLSRDPSNILLARQSRLRLEGEIIRDNALAVSGLLHRSIGGPSVKPPQPAGISELTYANSAKWVESKGPDRYRRGMYTWFQRTSPYPMLMTFDAPDGVLSCVRREKSNTPLQALTLLNDAVFVECAQSLARRIITESGSADRLDHGFRLCLSRRPTEQEKASLTQLFHDLVSLARSSPTSVAPLAGSALPAGVDAAEAAAWVALARTLLNVDEFVTRE